MQIEYLADDVAALSIGIALRSAFCRLIGIQEDEVGVTVRQAQSPDGKLLQAIFFYDMAAGGNGYVAALRDHVGTTIKGALGVLDCARKCDAACHACLLSFGSQYEVERLDRHKALEFAELWL